MLSNNPFLLARARVVEITALTCFLIFGLSGAAWAQDDSQDGENLLDEAIQLKLDASSARDFDKVADKWSFITPVPGGVGPLTIAMLMRNTVKAHYIRELLWEDEDAWQ